MKNIIFASIFLFFLVSCKNDTVSVKEDYLEQAVGQDDNGKYVVTNLEAIKKQWQATLEQEGNKEELASFTISKGVTQGAVQEDYYILIAKNTAGTAKTAAILDLKKDKFYFAKQQGPESMIYLKIVCSGDCTSGCDPIVKINAGQKFLVCSPCIECVKNEQEMR